MYRTQVFIFATLFSIVAQSVSAESWSQFRGPNAGGLSKQIGKLPDEIGPEKNVVWKQELPPGHSSPVLTSNRIFLTAIENERLFTIAVDRETGAPVWKREARHAGLEEIHRIGSHTQPTPATDGERVVSFFGSYGLLCYDLEGKLLWERPMGPFKNSYGAASSPIIVGDLVITQQDHDIDSFLLALDKRSGEPVWRTDRGEFPRGFTTPVVWESGGKTELVAAGALRVAGYDLETGKEIWTVHGMARIANMTPVVGDDGNLYVAEWAPGGDEVNRINAGPYEAITETEDKNDNGKLEPAELTNAALKNRFKQIDRDKDGHITAEEYNWMRKIFNTAHNVVVAIKPGGSGDVTETHVLWKRKRFLPYVPSPVYYDGHLFMIKSGGILSSLNCATGERIKQGRVPNTKDYYSSPIVGDGKLFLLNQQGELTVLSAEPKWKVLSKAAFNEEAYATPAIADGRIYLRTAGHLYCFGLEQ